VKKNSSQILAQLLADLKSDQPVWQFLEYFHQYDFRSLKLRTKPQLYLVGGSVRDAFLGQKIKDYDLVVAGITKAQLAKFLASVPGKSVDVSSRNFGVFKFRPTGAQQTIDIALPRLDVYAQIGRGHKDVQTKTSSRLTIDDDLARRDFTINALAVNLGTTKLVDKHGGLVDLNKKIIRCVGDPRARLVDEDPTRILRALRFATSLNFTIEKKTLSVIKKHHAEINRLFRDNQKRLVERVAREMLASEFLRGFHAHPARYLELLDSTGVYRTILSPNLQRVWEQMKTTEQPTNFHSEGSVWNHTMLIVRNLSLLATNPYGLLANSSINLELASWLHDWGKVDTMVITPEGKYTYYNHPDVSADLAGELVNHLKLFSPFAKEDPLHVDLKAIKFLIKHHMLPSMSHPEELKDTTVAKYFLQDENLGQELLQIAFLDASSSIKDTGRQDFTGLQRMIKKIAIVRAKLQQIQQSTKIYPVRGQEIKQEISLFLFQKKTHQISPTTLQQLRETVSSPHGGRLIGQLKEKILEDALAHPKLYQKSRSRSAQIQKLIKKIT
jgi:poly(A) polymerase